MTDTKPPLPEPDITSYQTDSIGRKYELRTFSEKRLRAYGDARAAHAVAQHPHALKEKIRSAEARIAELEAQVKAREITDTTNAVPPLPEPAFSVPTCGLKIRTFTRGQMVTYGGARAAHAVAQIKAPQHSDDVAVDRFAQAMKTKLAAAREKGRGGWETCSPKELSRMLREHVEKGDPRDVANFCMFLWTLDAGIAPATAEQPQAREITDAEIDALLPAGLDFPGSDWQQRITRDDLHHIARAAIALAKGRGLP